MTTAVPATRARKPYHERARAGQGSTWVAMPGLAYLVGLVFAPLVVIVMYSFLSRAQFGVGVRWDFSFRPYIDLVYAVSLSGVSAFNPIYLQIFFASIVYAAITAVICFVMAVPIAMWIATRPESRRTILIFLVTIPFWTSLLIRTYAFIIILNNNGPINSALGWSGLIDSPIPMLYSPFATVTGLVYTFLPFMILPIYASAERFDFRLAEAAYDLGAKKWCVLRRVVLPSIRPGIIAGCVLVFIPALGSFLAPELLGGGKTIMIANVIAAQFGASRNWPFGASLSVMVLVITMFSLVIFVLLSKRINRTRANGLESLL